MRRWMVPLLLVCVTAGAQAQQEAPSAPRIPPERLEAALARVSRGDPPIGRVVGAAIEHARIAPEAAAGAASRARLRGLVPVARVGVRRGQGRDLSEAQTDETGRITFRSDDELTLHGTLTFGLDRLVFSGEEVSLLREERARRAEQADLVRTVVQVYFERRRLLLERELLGPDIQRTVRIEELTALLNAFTGGAFSRMMVPAR